MLSYIFKCISHILKFKHIKCSMTSKCIGHFHKVPIYILYILFIYILYFIYISYVYQYKAIIQKNLKYFLNSVIPLGECVFEKETHNPIILMNFHFNNSQVPHWFQSLGPGNRKRFKQKVSIEGDVGKRKSEEEQWFPVHVDFYYMIRYI